MGTAKNTRTTTFNWKNAGDYLIGNKKPAIKYLLPTYFFAYLFLPTYFYRLIFTDEGKMINLTNKILNRYLHT